MPKVAREIAEKRPEEIVRACRKLCRIMDYREITLQDISRETSLSRPAIYNYFQTKEEIFLALLKEEYDLWSESLEKLKDAERMSIGELADGIASSLSGRGLMLKIQCMNLYEIEENSRMERLICFKRSYLRSTMAFSALLRKFIKGLDEDGAMRIVFEFYPFMYGIYPYVSPTGKQLAAMAETGIRPTGLDIRGITLRFLEDILRRYKEE